MHGRHILQNTWVYKNRRRLYSGEKSFSSHFAPVSYRHPVCVSRFGHLFLKYAFASISPLAISFAPFSCPFHVPSVFHVSGFVERPSAARHSGDICPSHQLICEIHSRFFRWFWIATFCRLKNKWNYGSGVIAIPKYAFWQRRWWHWSRWAVSTRLRVLPAVAITLSSSNSYTAYLYGTEESEPYNR